MSAIFTGFDNITSQDELRAQMPTGLDLIHANGATLVADNRGGQALSLTNGAHLKMAPPGAGTDRNVYLGVRVTLNDVATNASLAQFSIGGEVAPLVKDYENQSVKGCIFFIKNGAIHLKTQSGTAELTHLKGRTSFYFEVRWRYAKTSQNLGSTYVCIDGLKVHEGIGMIQFQAVYLSVYLGYSPSGSGIVVDDIYFAHQNAGLANSFTDSVMPILASGHVKSIPLTGTQSNTFNVTGDTAHAAISDDNDNTYIESNESAEASFNLSTKIANMFGLNLTLRGSSAAEGVASVMISSSTGSNLTQQVNIGLNSVLASHIIPIEKLSNVNLVSALKEGAILKVST